MFLDCQGTNMYKLHHILLAVFLQVSCHSERGTKSESPNGAKGIEVEEDEFSTLNTLKGLEM